MTSKLERRYRALLKLLPGWYREERADEMVDTFISGRQDDVDQEHGWPGWAETGAVATLAVRTRLSGADGPSRAVALGDAVRLVAMIGLLAHAVLSVGDIVRAASLQYIPSTAGLEPTSYFWRFAAVVAAVGAFTLIFTRWRGTAKALALVALVPTLFDLLTMLNSGPPADAVLWRLSVLMPLWIATLCLFAGFHREAPTPSPRVWVWAAVTGTVIMVAWNWYAAFVATDVFGMWLTPWSLEAWVIAVVGAVMLVRATPPYVRLGMAIYIALTLPQQVMLGIQMAEMSSMRALGSLTLGGVTCLLLVGIALAVSGLRGHRALSLTR